MKDLKAEILNAYGSGRLLEIVGEVRYADRESFAQALSQLDETRQIDLIACIMSGPYPTENKHLFFTVKSVFESALPYMARTAREVMDCVVYLFSSASNDLSAGWIFDPFIKYCKRSRDQALEAINVAMANPEKYGLLLPASLHGLSSLDFSAAFNQCLSIASDKANALRIQGLFSLGGLEYPANDPDCRAQKARDYLISAMQSGLTEREFVACMRACVSIPGGFSKEFFQVWMALSLAMTTRDHPEIIHQMATIVAYKIELIPSGYIDPMGMSLVNVKAKKAGTVSVIDMALGRMVESGSTVAALTIVEELVTRSEDPVSASEFDGFGHLVTKDHLSLAMTRWFLSGHSHLCIWIVEMISSIHGNHITMSIAESVVKGKPDGYLLFIARKAIGYLYSHAITSASIVISCAEHCQSNECRAEIANLLLDPLLLNYSGKLMEYLKVRRDQSGDPIRDLINAKIMAHEGWLAEVKEIPRLPELSPSTRHRDLHSRYMQETVEESYKESAKKSIFMQLVSKKVILYGARASGMTGGPEEQRKRYETEMSTSSFEIEVPRLATVDPWNFDMTMRMYRVERLTSP